MALNAGKIQNNGGGNNGPKQEPIEAGTYPVRLVQVLDLGIQKQRPYKGEEKPPCQMISLTYEFLDEFCLDEDGEEMEDKPRWLSEDIPLRSLEADLATSTKRCKALDPDLDSGGDFTRLLGAPAMVTVVNRSKGDKVYTNITGLAQMSAKQAKKAPELVNPSKFLDLDEPDLEIFRSLPNWVQEKIEAALNFDETKLAELIENGGEPEAPEEKEEKPKAKEKAKAKKEPEPEEDDDDEDGDEW